MIKKALLIYGICGSNPSIRPYPEPRKKGWVVNSEGAMSSKDPGFWVLNDISTEVRNEYFKSPTLPFKGLL